MAIISVLPPPSSGSGLVLTNFPIQLTVLKSGDNPIGSMQILMEPASDCKIYTSANGITKTSGSIAFSLYDYYLPRNNDNTEIEIKFLKTLSSGSISLIKDWANGRASISAPIQKGTAYTFLYSNPGEFAKRFVKDSSGNTLLSSPFLTFDESKPYKSSNSFSNLEIFTLSACTMTG